MNDILINAGIALGLLFILIIPFYIASKRSVKQKKAELKKRLLDLVKENDLLIDDPVLIGTKAFAIDGTNRKCIILSIINQNEESHFIEKGRISAVEIKEVIRNSQVFELKLCYTTNKNQEEIILYKQFRDDEYDLKPLKEMAERVKLILNN